jgi:Tol biopolymer transport system component
MCSPAFADSKHISIWSFAHDGPAAFWTVPLDGDKARKSDIAPKVAEQLKGFTGARQEFRWAPSGRAVYLQAELKAVRNLWKVTVNPLTLRWESLERLTTGPGSDTSVALSRDGRKLAFTSGKKQIRVWSYPFDPNATNAKLYTVRVSGGCWVRVTDGTSWDDKPRWSPDGKTIYHVSLPQGSPTCGEFGSIPSGVVHSGGRFK